MATVKLGMDAKLYVNTGDSYFDAGGTPNWVVIDNIRDVTLDATKDTADATVRANNGWRAQVATLKAGSVSFKMMEDDENLGFQLIRKAALQNTTLELLIVSGDKDTPPSQGILAGFIVSGFNREESLEDAIWYNVTVNTTYYDHAPAFYVCGSCDAGEPDKSAGTDVYYDSSTKKYTFTSTGNTYAGELLEDYSTGGEVLYFDASVPE